MKVSGSVLALIVALGVAALPLPASALGVADPGFSYVDVNNDGLYDNTIDIGLLSLPNPVDIDALIINDGHFDTQQSEANYHAPCFPVSLVISHTREPAAIPFPISLKAGYNLIDYGRLEGTSSICLQACQNIDANGATFLFKTTMKVEAGRDVSFDKCIILGSGTSSTLCVSAGRDVSVTGSTMNTGQSVSLSACGCMTVEDTHVNASTTGATVLFDAGGLLLIGGTSGSNILSQGSITARSRCGSVVIHGGTAFLAKNGICVDAGIDADVTGATLDASSIGPGPVTIKAGRDVIGDSATTVINGSDVKVTACRCVNLDDSQISAFPGAICVTAQGDIYASGVSTRLNWSAGSKIAVTSTCGNIYARYADMAVTPATNPITFYAGGGLIDVTGSVFVGMVSYGPSGVTVVGRII